MSPEATIVILMVPPVSPASSMVPLPLISVAVQLPDILYPGGCADTGVAGIAAGSNHTSIARITTKYNSLFFISASVSFVSVIFTNLTARTQIWPIHANVPVVYIMCDTSDTCQVMNISLEISGGDGGGVGLSVQKKPFP